MGSYVKTKNSIRYKIIVSSLLVTSLVLCFCGIFSSVFFLNLMKQQVLRDERQKMNQSAVQIANTQEEMRKLAVLIAADQVIQKNLLEDGEKDIFAILAGKKEIANILSRHLNLSKDSFSLMIVTDQEVYYSSGLYTEENVTTESWYLDVKNSGKKKGFSSVHQMYRTQNQGEVPVISYIMEFYDLGSGTRRLGDIVVHVNSSEIIKQLHYDETILKNLRLTDSFGGMIWSSDGQAGAISQKQGGDILTADTAMMDGWNLRMEISSLKLLLKLKYIILFFIFLFLAALMVLGVILRKIAFRLLKPITILADAAKEVGKGQLDLVVAIDSEDEFGELADSFNHMVADIRKLLNDSVEYEKAAKEMEINRLMLQINPHFIYNTLNSIVYMAQIKGNEDIVIFSKAFISLLHDTLNVEAEGMFISLSQEIDHVKNYLVLQSYRYPQKFQVSYQIDQECLEAMIPNVLIQPLVENAVFHGICGKPGKGVLSISARKEGREQMVICVEDDGAGMTKEKARQLLESHQNAESGMRKIGIANIKERIRYIYGERFGMEISSREESGTKIIIRIPYQTKQEKDKKTK